MTKDGTMAAPSFVVRLRMLCPGIVCSSNARRLVNGDVLGYAKGLP